MHPIRTMPVSAGIVALGLSTLAAGQEAEVPPVGLEEVVVTAQRREENLQKAAVPVSAVSGSTLTEQSVTQAADLTRLVPSIQIAPAASLTQIYLRGVGTFGANAFAEQGVAFNLDGVYLSRPAAPAALFYDLERIEVLKGPQGTLYGRNASGGAVNVITAKPQLAESGGFLTAEYGNFDTFKASGAVNLPVGDASAVPVLGPVRQSRRVHERWLRRRGLLGAAWPVPTRHRSREPQFHGGLRPGGRHGFRWNDHAADRRSTGAQRSGCHRRLSGATANATGAADHRAG